MVKNSANGATASGTIEATNNPAARAIAWGVRMSPADASAWEGLLAARDVATVCGGSDSDHRD